MCYKTIIPAMSAIAVLSSVSGLAFSQNQEESEQRSSSLDEIVVTATHREASLQDTSMSVVAFSSDDLEMRSMDSVEGLRGKTPNLMVFGDTGGAQTSSDFTVRGIPRVGVYIDGVWQPFSSGLMDLSLENVERMEVLRGPQGTLYGRDSTGGAIRVTTKDPADEFGGTARVTLGTNERRDVQMSVDVPLTETLKSRISASKEDRGGYIDSVTLDKELGQIDKTIVSGDLLWEPTDRFYAKAKYTQTESHPTEARVSLWHKDQGANFVGFEQGMTGLYSLAGAPYGKETHVADYPGGDLGRWESRTNQGEPWDVEIKQASLELGYDLTDTITLTSWTSWVDQDTNGVVDYDNSEYDGSTVWSYRANEIFSQELQLSGTHGNLEWLAGAYYWQEDNGSRDMWWGFEEFQNGELDRNVALNSPECTASTQLLSCADTFDSYEATGDQDEIVSSEEEGYAVFTDVSYYFTNRIKATVGARYHDQDVETSTLSPVPGVTGDHPEEVGPVTQGDPLAGSPDFVDTASFDAFTMRSVLSWDVLDNAMTYLSYSEGFNAGGAAPIQTASGRELIPYDPEDITSYELGLRSTWLDNRLMLNAWLFQTQWDGIQLESPYLDPNSGVNTVTFVTQNAASAEAEGLELEANWQATDNLQLDMSLGLLDTGYTDFRFGDETAVSSGDAFAQAPERTVAAGAQYTLPLPNGANLVSRLDYTAVSGFQRYEGPSLHPENVGLEGRLGEFAAGDYETVDARISYTPTGVSNWQVALIGTNLTNEQYIDGGFYSPQWEIDMSTVARPREFAVEFEASF